MFNNTSNVHRVCVTTVALEKQQVLHTLSVCSLNYLVCKAHEPFRIAIYGLSGRTIFSTLSHKRRGFRGWGN